MKLFSEIDAEKIQIIKSIDKDNLTIYHIVQNDESEIKLETPLVYINKCILNRFDNENLVKNNKLSEILIIDVKTSISLKDIELINWFIKLEFKIKKLINLVDIDEYKFKIINEDYNNINGIFNTIDCNINYRHHCDNLFILSTPIYENDSNNKGYDNIFKNTKCILQLLISIIKVDSINKIINVPISIYRLVYINNEISDKFIFEEENNNKV